MSDIIINQSDNQNILVDVVEGLNVTIDLATGYEIGDWATAEELANHLADTDNPHDTTKTQVGLGNVPNVDCTNPSNIIQDSSHRFANDKEYEAYVIKLASLAQCTFAYIGNNLTGITFANYGGVTAHTCTLSYTGDNLTQSLETFVYGGQTWTITTTFNYTGSNLTSTTKTIVRV